MNGQKSLITILRDNTFIDIIVPKSLGCKFTSTNQEETEQIKKLFSNKKIFDIEELKEFTVMRDLCHLFLTSLWVRPSNIFAIFAHLLPIRACTSNMI